MLKSRHGLTMGYFRGERLSKTHALIGQGMQLGSSCPIRAGELYLLSNQSNSRPPLGYIHIMPLILRETHAILYLILPSPLGSWMNTHLETHLGLNMLTCENKEGWRRNLRPQMSTLCFYQIKQRNNRMIDSPFILILSIYHSSSGNIYNPMPSQIIPHIGTDRVTHGIYVYAQIRTCPQIRACARNLPIEV